MRVIAAILVIIFMMAHYGRISSYYHCVIINVVKNGTEADCDCQKILTAKPVAENKDAGTPVHIHSLSTDEFITDNIKNDFSVLTDTHCKLFAGFNNQYCFTAYHAPFVPPEANIENC